MNREAELGILLASGNTEEENLNFAGAINIVQERWVYDFSLAGLYASTNGEVNGQRITAIASTNYEVTNYSFIQSRVSHEDDRFSGFDSQSDLTFSYGHEYLRNRDNMRFTPSIGAGVRYSRLEDSTTETEPILRLAGEYEWNISETSNFFQDLSLEAGSEADIYRSRTGIETNILDNLSLRFTLTIKHQTTVPVDREETDTQTSVTFVMNF